MGTGAGRCSVKWAPAGCIIHLGAEAAQLAWAAPFTPVPRPATHAAPAFNGLFYATAATVIPVLFLAFAVQGRAWQKMLQTAAMAAGHATPCPHRPSRGCPSRSLAGRVGNTRIARL